MVRVAYVVQCSRKWNITDTFCLQIEWGSILQTWGQFNSGIDYLKKEMELELIKLELVL